MNPKLNLDLTLTSTPLNSVKNESNSNELSANCRNISSESLPNGSSNELRSHELPAMPVGLFPEPLTASYNQTNTN